MPPAGEFVGKGITLEPTEFELLRTLIRLRTGISFAVDSRFALERRLRDRIPLLSLRTFAEYCHYLQYHPNAETEWDEAVELITTHETYFFREEYALRAFRNELLPMLAASAASRKRLVIWSAGCSTGEEVYTLAILIHESGLFSDWEVRVYGSDISRQCIAAARRGVYGPHAFRVTTPEIKRLYFVERADGFHVIDKIKSVCHFGQMNLLHEAKVHVVGRQDAIFCRNVLIYLDAPARKKVIDSFHERLLPGGALILGHSESLLNVSTAFELLHLKGDLVYRKPVLNFQDLPSSNLDFTFPRRG